MRSDWDFLWEVDGAEREFAMETGLTYADLAYLEEQEEQERIRAERERIKHRNKAWKELKKLRDSGTISPEEFKKRKCEIFAVEIEQKRRKKELIKQLKAFHAHSTNNRDELKDSVKCACFGCVSTILVYHLSYDGETAVCPNCGKKAIVPFFEHIEYYLRPMHDYYYPDEDLEEYYDYY